MKKISWIWLVVVFLVALSVFYWIGGKGRYEYHDGMTFDTRTGISIGPGGYILTDFRKELKLIKESEKEEALKQLSEEMK